MIAFIETYCRVPEGKLLGQPMVLLPFQKDFLLDIYDNPAGTSRAYLSIARKNGKTALIAAIVLGHLVGPEAVQNSQITSGARSRKQAALVYKLAEKMVHLNPDLSKIIKTTPSEKMLVGLPMNVEYQAISAEAGTAHGLSPILAILDEVGQVKGPVDAFVEAIETSQGAYDDPLLIAISTQAAVDADMFSVWIDDALSSKDPRIVCHVHSAPEDADLMDEKAWAMANPALGTFRILEDLRDMATRASRQPSSENSFRWLYLNQRIDASAPFISKNVWKACGRPPAELKGRMLWGGLDLSSVNDLTAKVYCGPEEVPDPDHSLISKTKVVWGLYPTFWLPAVGLREKAQSDRVPYDIWAKPDKDGNVFLQTTPGRTVDYEFVAANIYNDFESLDIKKMAFDRWNWKHLRPWLLKAGFSEIQLDGDKDRKIEALFEQFGQGYQSMSPALNTMEADLLEGRIAHGNHPVLTMCFANATVTSDPAGNRKLDKSKSKGRIDGAVAAVMGRAVAGTYTPQRKPEYQMLFV